jgi:hypothetical protein
MQCTNHPTRSAVAKCEECGQNICSECKTTIGNKTYCIRCSKAKSISKKTSSSSGPEVIMDRSTLEEKFLKMKEKQNAKVTPAVTNTGPKIEPQVPTTEAKTIQSGESKLESAPVVSEKRIPKPEKAVNHKSYKKRSAGTSIRIFFITVVLGLVFGLIGIVIAAFVVKGINGLAGILIGLITGYLVGVIIGIAIMRKAGHYGSVGFGIIGGIVGASLVIILEEPLNLGLDPLVLFGTFFILVPLLCLIGFYLKRLPQQSLQEAK